MTCPTCQAGQLAQDGREPFVYLPYCRHPWLELRAILRDLTPQAS